MSRKILVVDDEESIRDLLSIILEGEGFEVITACDGNEGLTKALQEVPDLCILDLMMPNVAGGVLAGGIRDNEKTCNVPIIFLTGVFSDDEADMIKNRFAGERLLAKPIDKDALIKTINEALA
ncbi:response regulator [Desulfosarcina sp.]|nr:response regulator [Desulfosarcina sp.]